MAGRQDINETEGREAEPQAGRRQVREPADGPGARAANAQRMSACRPAAPRGGRPGHAVEGGAPAGCFAQASMSCGVPGTHAGDRSGRRMAPRRREADPCALPLKR